MKRCNSLNHTAKNSIYERDKVPIENFLKPGKPETELYKTCIDCRIIDRAKGRKYEQNKKEKIKKMLEKGASEDQYSVCAYFSHDTISKHDRNKVPKNLFLRYPEEPDYIKNPYKNCIDCRKYERDIKKKCEQKRSLEKIEDHFYCSGCSKQKPLNEISKKVNGEGNNTRCIECQEKANEYNKRHNAELKLSYRKIQLEYILKNQASCEICRSIFLIPEPGTQNCVELKTREEDGNRYVEYKNKNYLVKNFLEEFKDLLELRILDFDHLSEEEQMNRKLLEEGEKFIGKKGCVRSMNNEKEMIKEAKKCQLVDCRCHIKITI